MADPISRSSKAPTHTNFQCTAHKTHRPSCIFCRAAENKWVLAQPAPVLANQAARFEAANPIQEQDISSFLVASVSYAAA